MAPSHHRLAIQGHASLLRLFGAFLAGVGVDVPLAAPVVPLGTVRVAGLMRGNVGAVLLDIAPR